MYHLKMDEEVKETKKVSQEWFYAQHHSVWDSTRANTLSTAMAALKKITLVLLIFQTVTSSSLTNCRLNGLKKDEKVWNCITTDLKRRAVLVLSSPNPEILI